MRFIGGLFNILMVLLLATSAEAKSSRQKKGFNTQSPRNVALNDGRSLQPQISRSKDSNPFQKRHALNLEVFGRGGLYSLGYEFSPRWNYDLGAGFSYQSASPLFLKLEVFTIPLYLQTRFFASRHNLIAGGGITVVHLKATSEAIIVDEHTLIPGQNIASMTLPLPNFNAGYEYRSSSNLFFRAQSIFFYSGRLVPFAGISAGFIF